MTLASRAAGSSLLLAILILPSCSDQSSYTVQSAESHLVTLPICMDDDTKEHVRAIMLGALDHSFSLHIEKLYSVWMAQPTDTKQPERARHGVELGLKAYLQARHGVQQWEPPPCSNRLL